MARFVPFAVATLALVGAVVLGWWIVAAVLALIVAVGIYDLTQRKHSILRNYPLLGHARFALEALRPELQQYFIERNTDGRPFDRDTRTSIYERAKGIKDEQAFGTELDVTRPGLRVAAALDRAASTRRSDPPRVRIGGPDCTQPYEMALLNVSAMSFGALSKAALVALNQGAHAGGFAHDTGEGGLTEHHLAGRRRPDLGARQRLLRRPHPRRRLRRARVPGQGRARARQARLAQAQPGRQARHRRPAARAAR